MKTYILCCLLCLACVAIPRESGDGSVSGTDYYLGPVWSDGEGQSAPWYVEWGLELALGALGLGGVTGPGRKAVGAVARAVAKPLKRGGVAQA